MIDARKYKVWIDNNYYYYIHLNGLFSRTAWVSWYQKGKKILDFTGAREPDIQLHSWMSGTWELLSTPHPKLN